MKKTSTRTTKRPSVFQEILKEKKKLRRNSQSNQITMRDFRKLDLQPVPDLSPQEIQSMRERMEVSQSTFAGALNTSLSTVQKWETGEKKPSGAALMLLHVLRQQGFEKIMYAGRGGDRPRA